MEKETHLNKNMSERADRIEQDIRLFMKNSWLSAQLVEMVERSACCMRHAACGMPRMSV